MWVHCAVEKGRWGSVEEVVVDAMVAAIVGRECRVDSLAVAVLVEGRDLLATSVITWALAGTTIRSSKLILNMRSSSSR